VTYKGKSISDILETSIDECHALFSAHPTLARILQMLVEVGLGYMKIGQPATTVSGGEAQRIKLSRELARTQTGRTLYVLDEPTTGLHFTDVERLLGVLQRLVEQGNSVLVIEHNLDVIRTCDWLIDLGPEGGEGASSPGEGRVIAEGTPEQVASEPVTRARSRCSYTGSPLRRVPRTRIVPAGRAVRAGRSSTRAATDAARAASALRHPPSCVATAAPAARVTCARRTPSARRPSPGAGPMVCTRRSWRVAPVLDEELMLVGRTTTLSPSGTFVVGGSEGFVVQTDALRGGEPATDLHVIGRDARVLRAIALGEQRPTFLARYVDGRIDLIGPATALTRRDASDGTILGEVALDRIAWSAVHRVGDVLALCDRFDDRVTWIEPDLTTEQVYGRCGELQSREGPRLWSWDRFSLTRWVDRAPTDGATARVGDLLASVVVASEDEAFAGFLRDRELVVVHGEASGRATSYLVALENEELVAEGVLLGGRLVLVLNDPFTRRVRFVTLGPRP
jgi:hypothetical protein